MTRDIFWAKKSIHNGGYCWLPLGQHLKDTAFIIGKLWDTWLDDSQRKLIEASLMGGNAGGKDLAKFLAGVHDLGKCSPAFQIKSAQKRRSDLDEYLIEKVEGEGFFGLGDLTLANMSKSPHAMAGQALLLDFGVGDDIATIIGGHHGKPVSDQRSVKNQLKTYTKNYFQVSDETSEIYQRWRQAQREIFDYALLKNNYKDVNDLPRMKINAQVILYGLLIMAD